MSVDVGILREKIARLTDERDRLLTEVAGSQNLSGILNLMGDLLASAEAEAKMCEWISVNKRLPEAGNEWYLVFDGEYVGCAFFLTEYEDNLLLKHWSAAEDTGIEEDDITHWMPMPAAPPASGSGEKE
jgi:hypothetical protein